MRDCLRDYLISDLTALKFGADEPFHSATWRGKEGKSLGVACSAMRSSSDLPLRELRQPHFQTTQGGTHVKTASAPGLTEPSASSLASSGIFLPQRVNWRPRDVLGQVAATVPPRCG